MTTRRQNERKFPHWVDLPDGGRREIVARLGLADIQNFGLTWDDCYEFIESLGSQPHVTATPGGA